MNASGSNYQYFKLFRGFGFEKVKSQLWGVKKGPYREWYTIRRSGLKSVSFVIDWFCGLASWKYKAIGLET